ncbi:MAG: GNAT family N-acetyltransferase [Anaerolineae bacterium]
MTLAYSLQTVTSRAFAGDADFWKIRDLLIQTYPLTPTGFNWEIRRWDGSRFHNENAAIPPEWNEQIHLWETPDGCLVGAVHTEGRMGEAFLQLHPDYRHVEEDMIAWAEEHLPRVNDQQQRQLDFAVFDYDSPRRTLLRKRGYEMLPYTFVTRRMRFGLRPLPEPVLAEGYLLRCTDASAADCQRLADVLNAGFNRTIHTMRESQNFALQSPSFSANLNLVAQAPDGSFGALVGLTYNKLNHYGVVEPVCTHPDHRRKGLARTLIFEGLHRVKALGATDAYVDTGDMVPANALYDDVGFTEAYRGNIWRKLW